MRSVLVRGRFGSSRHSLRAGPAQSRREGDPAGRGRAQLEPERDARLASLRTVPHQQWTKASLAFLRDGVTVTAGGIPMKRAYGSDFPFREPAPLPIVHHRAEGQPSYARGGLSNVWGASVLPFRRQDMEGWPIAIEDLEPHYRECSARCRSPRG